MDADEALKHYEEARDTGPMAGPNGVGAVAPAVPAPHPWHVLSRGTPMMLAGDEFRNSQMGNNNAYCQDSQLSWLDWADLVRHADVFEFCRLMIRLRRTYEVVRDPTLYTGVNATGYPMRDGVAGVYVEQFFRAAGHDAMQAACDEIGGCETGSAVITEGFALPSKWVIHAVGPKYSEGDPNQAVLLGKCYRAALDLCESNGLSTVSFPLISSGIYGYPKQEALQIAMNAILSWLSDHENRKTAYLCLMDETLYSAALEIMKGKTSI